MSGPKIKILKNLVRVISKNFKQLEEIKITIGAETVILQENYRDLLRHKTVFEEFLDSEKLTQVFDSTPLFVIDKYQSKCNALREKIASFMLNGVTFLKQIGPKNVIDIIHNITETCGNVRTKDDVDDNTAGNSDSDTERLGKRKRDDFPSSSSVKERKFDEESDTSREMLIQDTIDNLCIAIEAFEEHCMGIFSNSRDRLELFFSISAIQSKICDILDDLQKSVGDQLKVPIPFFTKKSIEVTISSLEFNLLPWKDSKGKFLHNFQVFIHFMHNEGRKLFKPETAEFFDFFQARNLFGPNFQFYGLGALERHFDLMGNNIFNFREAFLQPLPELLFDPLEKYDSLKSKWSTVQFVMKPSMTKFADNLLAKPFTIYCNRKVVSPDHNCCENTLAAIPCQMSLFTHHTAKEVSFYVNFQYLDQYNELACKLMYHHRWNQWSVYSPRINKESYNIDRDSAIMERDHHRILYLVNGKEVSMSFYDYTTNQYVSYSPEVVENNSLVVDLLATITQPGRYLHGYDVIHKKNFQAHYIHQLFSAFKKGLNAVKEAYSDVYDRYFPRDIVFTEPTNSVKPGILQTMAVYSIKLNPIVSLVQACIRHVMSFDKAAKPPELPFPIGPFLIYMKEFVLIYKTFFRAVKDDLILRLVPLKYTAFTYKLAAANNTTLFSHWHLLTPDDFCLANVNESNLIETEDVLSDEDGDYDKKTGTKNFLDYNFGFDEDNFKKWLMSRLKISATSNERKVFKKLINPKKNKIIDIIDAIVGMYNSSDKTCRFMWNLPVSTSMTVQMIGSRDPLVLENLMYYESGPRHKLLGPLMPMSIKSMIDEGGQSLYHRNQKIFCVPSLSSYKAMGTLENSIHVKDGLKSAIEFLCNNSIHVEEEYLDNTEMTKLAYCGTHFIDQHFASGCTGHNINLYSGQEQISVCSTSYKNNITLNIDSMYKFFRNLLAGMDIEQWMKSSDTKEYFTAGYMKTHLESYESMRGIWMDEYSLLENAFCPISLFSSMMMVINGDPLEVESIKSKKSVEKLFENSIGSQCLMTEKIGGPDYVALRKVQPAVVPILSVSRTMADDSVNTYRLFLGETISRKDKKLRDQVDDGHLDLIRWAVDLIYKMDYICPELLYSNPLSYDVVESCYGENTVVNKSQSTLIIMAKSKMRPQSDRQYHSAGLDSEGCVRLKKWMDLMSRLENSVRCYYTNKYPEDADKIERKISNLLGSLPCTIFDHFSCIEYGSDYYVDLIAAVLACLSTMTNNKFRMAAKVKNKFIMNTRPIKWDQWPEFSEKFLAVEKTMKNYDRLLLNGKEYLRRSPLTFSELALYKTCSSKISAVDWKTDFSVQALMMAVFCRQLIKHTSIVPFGLINRYTSLMKDFVPDKKIVISCRNDSFGRVNCLSNADNQFNWLFAELYQSNSGNIFRTMDFDQMKRIELLSLQYDRMHSFTMDAQYYNSRVLHRALVSCKNAYNKETAFCSKRMSLIADPILSILDINEVRSAKTRRGAVFNLFNTIAYKEQEVKTDNFPKGKSTRLIHRNKSWFRETSGYVAVTSHQKDVITGHGMDFVYAMHEREVMDERAPIRPHKCETNTYYLKDRENNRIEKASISLETRSGPMKDTISVCTIFPLSHYSDIYFLEKSFDAYVPNRENYFKKGSDETKIRESSGVSLANLALNNFWKIVDSDFCLPGFQPNGYKFIDCSRRDGDEPEATPLWMFILMSLLQVDRRQRINNRINLHPAMLLSLFSLGKMPTFEWYISSLSITGINMAKEEVGTTKNHGDFLSLDNRTGYLSLFERITETIESFDEHFSKIKHGLSLFSLLLEADNEPEDDVSRKNYAVIDGAKKYFRVDYSKMSTAIADPLLTISRQFSGLYSGDSYYGLDSLARLMLGSGIRHFPVLNGQYKKYLIDAITPHYLVTYNDIIEKRLETPRRNQHEPQRLIENKILNCIPFTTINEEPFTVGGTLKWFLNNNDIEDFPRRLFTAISGFIDPNLDYVSSLKTNQMNVVRGADFPSIKNAGKFVDTSHMDKLSKIKDFFVPSVAKLVWTTENHFQMIYLDQEVPTLTFDDTQHDAICETIRYLVAAMSGKHSTAATIKKLLVLAKRFRDEVNEAYFANFDTDLMDFIDLLCANNNNIKRGSAEYPQRLVFCRRHYKIDLDDRMELVVRKCCLALQVIKPLVPYIDAFTVICSPPVSSSCFLNIHIPDYARALVLILGYINSYRGIDQSVTLHHELRNFMDVFDSFFKWMTPKPSELMLKHLEGYRSPEVFLVERTKKIRFCQYDWVEKEDSVIESNVFVFYSPYDLVFKDLLKAIMTKHFTNLFEHDTMNNT